jgi:hypothetical protein
MFVLLLLDVVHHGGLSLVAAAIERPGEPLVQGTKVANTPYMTTAPEASLGLWRALQM